MDLKEAGLLCDDIANHWYYRSKAAAMIRLLRGWEPSVILDVGAGSGFFSRYLLRHTSASEAWCIDPNYPRDSNALEDGKPLHYRRFVNSTAADLVLLMDVLEHVADDVDLLAAQVAKASPGARFLISVPAFQLLWSGHDEFLEHKRRYTIGGLEEVVQDAGLKVAHSAYYFGLVFPVAATLRLGSRWGMGGTAAPRSQLRTHAPWLNQTLWAICRAELPLLMVNRFAGLTAFCVAERP